MNVPLLVFTSAVYVRSGEMHMAGGLANLVVRGEEPSAFGQGVAPLKEAPSGTVGTLTAPGAPVVLGEALVTFLELLPPPVRAATLSTRTRARKPATKIRMNDQGAVVSEDYSAEVVHLSNVVGKRTEGTW